MNGIRWNVRQAAAIYLAAVPRVGADLLSETLAALGVGSLPAGTRSVPAARTGATDRSRGVSPGAGSGALAEE